MIDLDNDIISIHRTKRDFVEIPNNILEDKNVTLEARGLYCIICMLPLEFKYSDIYYMCEQEDIDKIPDLVDQLIRNGYLSYKE